MKDICIDELHLRYFKGVEKADYEFCNGINVVKGCNGIGKSTIADAICWVLFGTNQAGDTKFGVKTKDENGNEIPDVEHTVEIILQTRANENEEWAEYKLTRTLTDVRKEDGSVANNYKYQINGNVETAGDFKKAVDGICPEKVFRLCSSPNAFVQMDWNEQRRMLTEMFGEPSMADVIGEDKQFDPVRELLEKEDIDKVMKHLNYKKKEVQRNLDEVPVRLIELEKVLPKAENWAKLVLEIETKRAEREKKLSHVTAIDMGNGGVFRQKVLDEKIKFTEKRKAIMEREAINKMADMNREKAAAINEQQNKLNKVVDILGDLKRKISSLGELVERCDNRKMEMEAESQKGVEQWKTLIQKRWEWDENASFCPTCGQPLPEDRVKEMREKSEEKFNVAIADEKKKLRELATKIKNEINLCDNEREKYQKEKTDAQKMLKNAEKQHLEESLALDKLKTPDERNVEDIIAGILAEKPSYKDVCDELKNLEKEKSADCLNDEDKNMKALLQNEAENLAGEIKTLQARLNTKEQRDNVVKQIDAVKSEKTVWQKQLDEIDEQIDAADKYRRKMCEALEENVNRHFGLVKWSMFRRQLDGTEKPWCECSVDGVPYADLNTADKINAGLDINAALKEYYGVDAPCVIDNAESILKPLYRGGQQIRLTVTEDENIIIEQHDAKDEV